MPGRISGRPIAPTRWRQHYLFIVSSNGETLGIKLPLRRSVGSRAPKSSISRTKNDGEFEEGWSDQGTSGKLDAESLQT